MPFSDGKNARNIRLRTTSRGDYILSAECYDSFSKRWNHDEFNLDRVLGNVDANFKWGGSRFSKSAQGIHLEFDRPEKEEGATLVALLLDASINQVHPSSIKLDDHIMSNWGSLEIVGLPPSSGEEGCA
jgi:hypothetical protein